MLIFYRAVVARCAVVALVINLALTMMVTADAGQRNRSIKARVLMPDGSPSQTIKVRLEGGEGELIRESFTDTNGIFEVASLNTGTYAIVVPTNDRNYATTTERIEITRYSPDVVAITVNLSPKEESGSRRNGRHTVSAREASNAIPREAHEVYNRSVDLSRRGQIQQAIEELKRAIAIYPEYVQAYNDLGVAYMKLDLIDEAITALERAGALDPQAFNPRLNLGVANVRRQNFAQAEAPLRAAIGLDASAPLAHLYLGITLWKTSRAEQAEDEFGRALSLGGSEIAIAHFYLGQLFADKDRIAEAIAELESYLKQKPVSDYARQARQKIAELRDRHR